jgi:hypothetical protein
MPGGIRFADILDDALTAMAWDAPRTDQPPPRTPPPRLVSHTPLYNLHRLAERASVARVVVNAYAGIGGSRTVARTVADGESGQGASIWSNPRTGDWRGPSRSGNAPAPSAAPRANEPESHGVRPAVSTVPPVRLRRRLTPAQWRAVEAFNQLGAGIRVDFSVGELRSAFRMLARRYHPDRHPDASVVDRHRLAWQFTTIRNSYETLLTALDSPGL